ncbi:hypothetical protein NZNM25_03020 [Nitrosopumilus zosterae]|uniref:Uncharacterized protein n=1 Tax=Nitrosopumilus zosterae TaxID=718286 RepID=A0A2S2KPQ0_9ARCH|nr:hypothetical protein [Nitrosopumilus zosterae]BDQ31301.1 hypothetical protein NZOSNM25_001414 [Nitrosopumilus zosterae]GBH33511.1 hypothetical protein NZNM25_03020 [Nitrosopumilus zosterae]
MTNEELNGISMRLDAILSVLMEQTVVQEKTAKDKISLLNDFDFDTHEIARILHTSNSNVAKELSLLKKRGKK